MDDPSRRHTWTQRVGWALRGVAWGVRTQSNFAIHLAASVAVVVVAVALGASRIEWCVLVLCMAIVLAAELFNTAMEHMARAVTREHQEEIRNALDTSAGAVLVVATGAAIVGAVIFIYRLGVRVAWW